MRRLYEPFKGHPADRAALRKMAADTERIAALVDEGFHGELELKEISGRNRIAGALVAKLAARTLEVDAARPDGEEISSVVALEENYAASFRTPAGHDVRLRGIFDRVDRVGGRLRIVDYKTGFQLLLYLLILSGRKQEPKVDDVENVLLEIYYTRNLYTGGQAWRTPLKSEYEEFIQELGTLLDRILNPDEPFTACEDGAACEYCPFTALCNR